MGEISTAKEERPSRSRWHSSWQLIAGGIVGVIGVVGLILSLTVFHGGTATSFTLNGGVVLGSVLDPSEISVADNGSSCSGYGGYDDLVLGAPITVTDATGKVIALGSITRTDVIKEAAIDGYTPRLCAMFFSVPKVPAGRQFYGVEVTHRGVLKYTEAQMRGGDVTMTLGS